MATGSKKREQQADKALKAGLKATQPKSYSDPFGGVDNGVFTPNMSQDQTKSLSNVWSGIAGASDQLNKPFTLDDYYNNPFRQNTYDLLANPIMRQYQQDDATLSNNLNARGQTGSSYDALTRRNLMQDRDFKLNQASLQGLSASADAYNQMYNNNLNSLGALGQSALQQQQYIYQPANMAMAYQNAVAPLQNAQAGLYGNQQTYFQNKKTGLDNMLDLYKSLSAAAAQAAGAMA